MYNGTNFKRSFPCRFALLPLLLLFWFLPFSALASSHITDDCGKSPCICFLQEGDEGVAVQGVVKYLKAQHYLSNSPSSYTSAVTAAVKKLQAAYALDETGTLDDDTLTCLIFGMTADKLDVAQPSSTADEVWIPTNGGKKRHSRPTCSKMISPRKMSARNAEALGLDPCKKCNPR